MPKSPSLTTPGRFEVESEKLSQSQLCFNDDKGRRERKSKSSRRTVMCEKDVLALNVSMQNVVCVDIGERAGQLDKPV